MDFYTTARRRRQHGRRHRVADGQPQPAHVVHRLAPAGNAVVVGGRPNTRYTRTGEPMRRSSRTTALPTVGGADPRRACRPRPALRRRRVTRPAEHVRGRGQGPLPDAAGSSRSTRRTTTTNAARSWTRPPHASDHDPIAVGCSRGRPTPRTGFSEQFGGPGGGTFNDIERVPPAAGPRRSSSGPARGWTVGRH